MSITIREQAVLQSFEVSLAADPGLAEIARFFEQIAGGDPMPRRERISGWPGRLAVGPVGMLLAVIVVAAVTVGHLAWRGLRRAIRALVQAEGWYAETLAIGTGHVPERETGGTGA